MKISVVIPAYNEAKVILLTISQVKDYLEKNFSSFEIIVVDDCSRDSTLEILKSFEGIRIIRNLRNHGKGYTVAKGVKAAHGDLILFMDADNSTQISELDSFLPQIAEYDLVIASRALADSNIKIKQNFLKIFLGRLGNLVSRIFIHKSIGDTQCGFKLFSKDLKFIFEKLTISGFSFDFELIFLAKKYKFRIKEMPITWENNFDSTVKWHDYPKTFMDIIKINLNNLFGKYN
ncbi:glycosyltransferase family 2 protein [Patescibacteria group bacterium]|nr:glycosyltransferase family 2 protein [Patescibacteria group bacterium]